VSTCHGRLDELIRLMRWLPSAGVADLAALTSDDCDAYCSTGVISSMTTASLSENEAQAPGGWPH